MIVVMPSFSKTFSVQAKTQSLHFQIPPVYEERFQKVLKRNVDGGLTDFVYFRSNN